MNKKTIRDLRDADLRGKRALVRVDFNVPLDDHGRVTDAETVAVHETSLAGFGMPEVPARQ